MITQKPNPSATTSINKLLGFSTRHGGFNSRWALCFLLLSLMSLLATAQNAAPPPPNVNEKPKFNLKMAIVMCLLVAVFFILGFLSVYTRECAQRRLRGRVDLALGMARGLDPEIIETFPTFVYATVKAHKIGSGSLECAVCLNEFQDDETLRLIPKCDHVFHPDCIDMWLISHSTCPVCRTNLVPKPGELPYTGYEQYLDQDTVHTEPDQHNRRPDGSDEPQPQRQVSVRVTGDHQGKDKEATDKTNLLYANKTPNQSLPPRSRSTGFGLPRSISSGWRFSGLFPRSQSTGNNLLVRPGENSERYTLKLPEEVRNKLLMSSALNRTRSSNAALPRVGSTRRGYRSPSIRNFRQNSNSSPYERFDDNARSDRWHISMTPPFVHRSGSVRSSMGIGGDSVAAVPASNRPTLERKVIRKDEDGQRPTDLLRPEDQV